MNVMYALSHMSVEQDLLGGAIARNSRVQADSSLGPVDNDAYIASSLEDREANGDKTEAIKAETEARIVADR